MIVTPSPQIPSGDQSHRGRLPAAGSGELPDAAAPADAGLLAEGAQRATQLQPDPQRHQQEHPHARRHRLLHTGTQVQHRTSIDGSDDPQLYEDGKH